MTVNNKLPVAWYGSLGNQNRYRSQCESSCEYKLLSPSGTIPPFQIFTGQLGITIEGWNIVCAEDSVIQQDLEAEIDELELYTSDNAGDFISYSGAALASLNVECGSYYMTIITNNGTYYSEVFELVDFEDNHLVAEIDLPLRTAWRYWDDEAKLEQNKKQCLATCPYYLITLQAALPPFMFRILHTANVVNRWTLRDIDETCEHELDFNSYVQKVQVGAYDYIYYGGTDIENLPCGKFTSIVQVGAEQFYSEPIEIVAVESQAESEGFLQTDSAVNLTTDDGVQLMVD